MKRENPGTNSLKHRQRFVGVDRTDGEYPAAGVVSKTPQRSAYGGRRHDVSPVVGKQQERVDLVLEGEHGKSVTVRRRDRIGETGGRDRFAD